MVETFFYLTEFLSFDFIVEEFDFSWKAILIEYEPWTMQSY